MRFKQYITEKTFMISKDVNYIYNECFDPVIKEIWKNAGTGKGKFLGFNDYTVDRLLKGKYSKFFTRVKQGYGYVIIDKLFSEKLPSKQAQKASKVNPAVIECGSFTEGNYYRPMETQKAYQSEADKSIISLSMNHSALNTMLNNNIKYILKDRLSSFYQEFRPERMKATIAHEISHWMHDTFHNFQLTNLLKTIRELGRSDLILLNKKDVNMTYFEIDAQIHGIKQLKMANRKVWNEWELKDVYFHYNSLRYMGGSIYKNHGKEIGDLWQKALVKRMAREKLLGKNMKKFAKYPEDF